MTVPRITPFGWSALAVVGAILLTPLSAFGWHHSSYGYKVKGWGAPLMIGAPAVVGTGVQTQSALITSGFGVVPQSALITSGFGVVPQSALITGDGLGTAQSGRLSSSGSSGGGTGTGTGGITTTTTVCPELVGRLDKIETRLTTLETRLGTIEAKVDSLLAARNAELQRQARELELKQLEARVIGLVNDARKHDTTIIINMFNEVQRRNVLLVDELLKPEAQRNLKSVRDELAKPIQIP